MQRVCPFLIFFLPNGRDRRQWKGGSSGGAIATTTTTTTSTLLRDAVRASSDPLHLARGGTSSLDEADVIVSFFYPPPPMTAICSFLFNCCRTNAECDECVPFKFFLPNGRNRRQWKGAILLPCRPMPHMMSPPMMTSFFYNSSAAANDSVILYYFILDG